MRDFRLTLMLPPLFFWFLSCHNLYEAQMAGQDRLFSIAAELLHLAPGGPAEPRRIVIVLSQATEGHLCCLQDELYLKITFLAGIKAAKPNKSSKGLARRQEPAKLAIGQWPHPQPKFGLLVPDAAAGHRVHSQGAIRLTRTEAGAISLREHEPLSDKLRHRHWHPEIILQNPFESTGRVGMLGEKAGIE